MLTVTSDSVEAYIKTICAQYSISEWFQHKLGYRNRELWFMSTCREYLKGGERIADCGGGIGRFGLWLFQAGIVPKEYVVIDRNETYLAAGKMIFNHFGYPALFIRSNIMKDDPPRTSFDIVLCFGVSYDLKLDMLFDYIHKLLRVNGLVIITIVDKTSLNEDHKPRYKNGAFTAEEIVLLLKKYQFTVLKFEYSDNSAGFREFGIIASAR